MVFEFVVNRQTVEALGLTVPYDVALQITRVVEGDRDVLLPSIARRPLGHAPEHVQWLI